MNKRIREDSPIKTFHVCVRAHNGKDIFDDYEVREKFIKCMVRAFHKYNLKIPGWTVMTNHAHMLVEGDKDGIARAFQSIGGSFCRWFNRREGEKGAVFDSRYYLKPIKDRRQYFICLAYLYNNPVRAKMVRRAEDYKWSTYNEIYNLDYELADHQVLVDRNLIEWLPEIVADSVNKVDRRIDPMSRVMVSDFDIEEALQEEYPEYDPRKSRELTKEQELEIVVKLFELHSTSQTCTNAYQVARITGIRYHRVRKIVAAKMLNRL